MKKAKKVLSLIMGILFLLNNLSFADTNLATESHLAPLTSPQYLDVFKLTAGIINAQSQQDGGRLSGDMRNVVYKIPYKGKITLKGDEDETRKPKPDEERLIYKFRKKKEFDNGNVIFIPCVIQDGRGIKDLRFVRAYLCCAKKISEGKYDFEFIPNDKLMPMDVEAAMEDDDFLMGLANKTRPSEVKAAIGRFVGQQNGADVIIAGAILGGQSETLVCVGSKTKSWVTDVMDFIRSEIGIRNLNLTREVNRLFDSGQVRIIQDGRLIKPHAGGIGIYLPNDEKYLNARTLVHEIFAKCGFTHEECEMMEELYREYSFAANWSALDSIDDETQGDFKNKIINASFEKRWENPLITDYHKKTAGLAAGDDVDRLLAPLDMPQLVDVMKLSAGIAMAVTGSRHEAVDDLARPRKAKQITIDRIDKSNSSIPRKGDRLTYELQDQLIFRPGDVRFFSCTIDGVKYGNTKSSKRHYLCCATIGADRKFTFEFIPESKLPYSSVRETLEAQEIPYLMDLAKRTRPLEIKRAIERFAIHQNDTDVIIAEAIAKGNSETLQRTRTSYAKGKKWIDDAIKFIESPKGLNKRTLAMEIKTLVDSGQLRIIDDSRFTKPHAGGIGIYLPNDEKYLNAKTIIHEVFAKCGFTHDECEMMATMYEKYAVQKTRWTEQLTGPEELLLQTSKVREASFANRWNNPLTTDYHKESAQDDHLTYDLGTARAVGNIRTARIMRAVQIHQEQFGENPESAAEGIGRVNLLGEHTDYAGGKVLPIAIKDFSVIATVSQAESNKITLHSPRYGKYEIAVKDLADISSEANAGKEAIDDEFAWARYALGVIRKLMDYGVEVGGLNIAYDGNVPIGGGLSSSAAVETSIFVALSNIYKPNISRREAVWLCQKAEHWLGNSCGTMDQYASLFGSEGNAMLLDCDTLTHEDVDLSFLKKAGYAVVTVDTGLPKTDESWKTYNTRVNKELAQAVEFFRQRHADTEHFPNIETIKDIAPKLTYNWLDTMKERLVEYAGTDVYMRVLHIVNEEIRVRKVARIAEEARGFADAGNTTELERCIKEIGEIISDGHTSLKDFYEVSSPQLDFLVNSALNHGSVGSRLTGAGFVGNTVNIVKIDMLPEFTASVGVEYQEEFPDDPVPTARVIEAGNAAAAIDLSRISLDGFIATADPYFTDSSDVVFDEVAIDAAVAEVEEYTAENRPVIFAPETFADSDRRAEFEKQYPGAELVPFNQETRIGSLTTLLMRPDYAKRPRAVITLGLSEAQCREISTFLAAHEGQLKGTRPLNFAKPNFRRSEDALKLRSFQDGVMAITMKMRALPKEPAKYEATFSYAVLMEELKQGYLPANTTAKDYIFAICSGITVSRKFAYILTCVLAPIVPMDVPSLKPRMEHWISA